MSHYGDELSLSRLKKFMEEQNLLGTFTDNVNATYKKKIDPFETLVCWLFLISSPKYSLDPVVFPIEIKDLKKSGKISISENNLLDSISNNLLRKVKRKIYFTGGVRVDDAANMLSLPENITRIVLQSMNLKKIDKYWYGLKANNGELITSKVPLRVAGLKMLSIVPEIDFDIFCDGLRRHVNRFYSSIAPSNVILSTLPVLGFDVNSQQKVYATIRVETVLSKSEEIFISSVNKKHGIVSFMEVAEEFFDVGLSLPAVSVVLRRSPIIEKIEDGLYKIRGVEHSWQQLDDAKKRQKRFDQDEEIAHGLDGIIRLRVTINTYAYLTGVIMTSSIKSLAGSWPIISNGEKIGDMKYEESYLWGLLKVFKKLDIQRGERVELAFNTWNRILSVEKVKNENS